VSGVVVAKLDRLSRSTVALGKLLDRSRDEGWNLVALDVGLDLSTPTGRAMAGIVGVFAQWERETISERTCRALEAARARGTRLGRPPLVATETLWLVRYLRRREHSFQHIADILNAREIPAPARKSWNGDSVRAVYLRAEGLGSALKRPRKVAPPRPVSRLRLVARARPT
jgi:DNA invertase Pin-like site-specific DNA recombinase